MLSIHQYLTYKEEPLVEVCWSVRNLCWSRGLVPLSDPPLPRSTLPTLPVSDRRPWKEDVEGWGWMASQIDEPALIWSLIFWGVKQQDRGPWLTIPQGKNWNTWKGACTWKLHLYPWFTSWTIFAAISLRHYTLCFDSTAKETSRYRKPRSQRKSVVVSRVYSWPHRRYFRDFIYKYCIDCVGMMVSLRWTWTSMNVRVPMSTNQFWKPTATAVPHSENVAQCRLGHRCPVHVQQRREFWGRLVFSCWNHATHCHIKILRHDGYQL